MNIDEAREKKYELEENLTALLDNFSHATDLPVESIEVLRHENGRPPHEGRFIYVARVKIDLGHD